MMPTSPSPPLKFRTVGFPQYGFKASLSDRACRPSVPVERVPRIPGRPRRLPSPSPTSITAQPPGSASRTSRHFREPLYERPSLSTPGVLGSGRSCVVSSPPRLLQPHPSVSQARAATSPLSRLIRRAFAVRARRGDPRDLPYFHCRTVHTCRRPYAGGSGRPPVTMASRYQASSTSQRVATHNCPSLPAIPDGVKHFGAASFASCCGPCVCLALLTGYDEEEPPRLHLASAELRHSRLDRDMSPPPGESQARWANGKPPIVGTCTRQVTAASEAARETNINPRERSRAVSYDRSRNARSPVVWARSSS